MPTVLPRPWLSEKLSVATGWTAAVNELEELELTLLVQPRIDMNLPCFRVDEVAQRQMGYKLTDGYFAKEFLAGSGQIRYLGAWLLNAPRQVLKEPR